MSVFQMGTATLDKLFLEYIMPGLNVEIRENSNLYGRFKTDSKTVLGKYAIFQMLDRTPHFRQTVFEFFPSHRQAEFVCRVHSLHEARLVCPTSVRRTRTRLREGQGRGHGRSQVRGSGD